MEGLGCGTEDQATAWNASIPGRNDWSRSWLLGFSPSILANAPAKALADGPEAQAPAIHMGDLCALPGSCCRFWRKTEQKNLCLCASFYLKQTKK